MRQILGATVLVLALCAPAFAGDTPNPSVSEPPDPPTSEPASDAGTPDGVTGAMLAVIESILALF